MKRITDNFFIGKSDGGGVNLQVGDGEGAQIVALTPEQWREAINYLFNPVDPFPNSEPAPTEPSDEPATDDTEDDAEKGSSDAGDDVMVKE